MKNLDLCPYTTLGEEVDSNVCSVNEKDDDGDIILNDVDLCPETPIGEEVDENGCSDSQLDDDEDGIPNDKDICANTPSGNLVDANGCTLLDSNNFTIEVIGETCLGKNNGQISISANEPLNYKLFVNGSFFDNFSPSFSLDNLTPNTYDICIEVEGVTSPYCYKVEVAAGATISGKSSINNKQLQVEVSEGTLPYQVYVNGNKQFETYQNEFSLDVEHGDIVIVKTAIECEGLYLKKVQLFNNLTVYPNPSEGLFTIAIPTNDQLVDVRVFNDISQLIISNTFVVINSRVHLDLTDKPVGVYIVKVYLDKEYVFKVVRK